MKTFNYIHKNSSAVVTLSAADFNDAEIQFKKLVRHPWEWRVENEEGTNE